MTDTGPIAITLASTLDYPAATDLMAELRNHQCEPAVLDASAVQHLGAPCLQVLLLAARSWQGADLALTISNASEAFEEGLARMGVTMAQLTAKGDEV